MDKLGINPGQLIAQIVNILIVLAVLRFLVWKPLISFINKRQERIVKSIKDAKEIEEKHKALEQEAEEIRQTARHEAGKFAEEKRLKAEELAREIQNRTQSDTDKIREDAYREAKVTKANAINEAQGDIVDIACAVAYRIIGETLTMPENSNLLANFLAVPASAVDIGSSVVITSAIPLSTEMQDKIKAAIKADLVEYKEDPSILGGLIFRSGITVVDSSIRGQLSEFRDALQKAR